MGFLDANQMICASCGGRPDSPKHQMTCVAPQVESPEAAEIRQLRKALEETIVQRDKAYETVDRLKRVLECLRTRGSEIVEMVDEHIEGGV